MILSPSYSRCGAAFLVFFRTIGFLNENAQSPTFAGLSVEKLFERIRVQLFLPLDLCLSSPPILGAPSFSLTPALPPIRPNLISSPTAAVPHEKTDSPSSFFLRDYADLSVPTV